MMTAHAGQSGSRSPVTGLWWSDRQSVRASGKNKKGSDGTQRTWNPAAFCVFRLFHAAYRPDTKSATSDDFLSDDFFKRKGLTKRDSYSKLT